MPPQRRLQQVRIHQEDLDAFFYGAPYFSMLSMRIDWLRLCGCHIPCRSEMTSTRRTRCIQIMMHDISLINRPFSPRELHSFTFHGTSTHSFFRTTRPSLSPSISSRICRFHVLPNSRRIEHRLPISLHLTPMEFIHDI